MHLVGAIIVSWRIAEMSRRRAGWLWALFGLIAVMLILPAHAKLNLALAVIARRDDGFHDIDSVLVPIDWHDLVGVAVQPASDPRVLLGLWMLATVRPHWALVLGIGDT